MIIQPGGALLLSSRCEPGRSLPGVSEALAVSRPVEDECRSRCNDRARTDRKRVGPSGRPGKRRLSARPAPQSSRLHQRRLSRPVIGEGLHRLVQRPATGACGDGSSRLRCIRNGVQGAGACCGFQSGATVPG